MRSKPFFDKTQQGSGFISVTSAKGNRNVIQAQLIRNLSERERQSEQPKTDIVLTHNEEMPDFYTVNAPIAVVEKFWKWALAGADIDLTAYSGPQGAYLASWPPPRNVQPLLSGEQADQALAQAPKPTPSEPVTEAAPHVDIIRLPSGKTKYTPRIAPF